MKFKTIQKIFLAAICSSALYACSEDELTDDTKKEPQSNVLSISSADELFAFAKRVNEGETKLDAKLATDIDISGKEWTPIGYDAYSIEYEGLFDGDGHTIKGLTITDEGIRELYKIEDDDQYGLAFPIGLFSSVGKKGIIKGLHLEDVSLQIPKCVIAGSLVGELHGGMVLTCTASGSIEGNTHIGGIIGTGYGTISGCVNHASVKGNGTVGGVTGVATVTIMSCKNYGKVEAGRDAGGIVGVSGANAVQFNLENYGDVTSTTRAGGIVGMAAGKLYNSINYGNVTGNTNVGGVIGSVDRGRGAALEFNEDEDIDDVYIENCVNLGSISGNEDTHAVIGSTDKRAFFTYATLNVSIKNCFYDETVNPSLSDDNASAIDGNTQNTLNDWVANKPAAHKSVAFKIWEKDETGKFVIKKK